MRLCIEASSHTVFVDKACEKVLQSGSYADRRRNQNFSGVQRRGSVLDLEEQAPTDSRQKLVESETEPGKEKITAFRRQALEKSPA
jgi:hypothetical protein